MLWMAIFLPRLIGEALGCSDQMDDPVAVGNARAVFYANRPAQALGVHAGLRRASALALAPALQWLERQPHQETHALRQLACWALQFTPTIHLKDPASSTRTSARSQLGAQHGLLLEVGPSLRLFGGRRALLAQLRAGLAEQALSASLACAPTAHAAWLLARHRDGLQVDVADELAASLAPLPLELLEHTGPHLSALASIGVRTLGDLIALPRAGLARRFGPALLDELDRSLGLQSEQLSCFEAPVRFEARLELLADVVDTNALLHAAQRLLIQFVGWLRARQAGATGLVLLGKHAELPGSRFEIRLAEPSRDQARLLGVLRETLATQQLPAPVHTLVLHGTGILPLSPESAALFPMPASARQELGRLIERLQARLGHAQVQRLCLAADHRPEHAQRLETLDALPGRRAGGTAAPPVALPRPLWLLAHPRPIPERQGRPWSEGPLSLLAGPERIESGWWDEALVLRDYFIAADDNGRMFWIYRQRLADPDGRPGWFLHGRFG